MSGIRKFGGFLLKFVVFLLLFISVVTSPIDRSKWQGHPKYQATFSQIDSLDIKGSTNAFLEAGWAKVNITPQEPTQLVGFKPRGPYKSVHDSLFVRSVALRVASKTVCIVSYDLLLAPPQVVEKVKEELGAKNVSLYFSATHTHTGFGGWDSQKVSTFITGSYNEERFNRLILQTLKAVNQSVENLSRASIGYGEVAAKDWVKNRLVDGGNVDDKLRIIKIKKQTNESCAIVSFSAHTTNIPSKILQLSRDYPGILVDNLESSTADFAMFMGGMMGSHKPKNPGLSDFELAETMGKALAQKAKSIYNSIEMQQSTSLYYHTIFVGLPKAQLRLTKNIGVRSGVFDFLFGELEASITYLRLDDILLLGMPCDFSGELYLDGNLKQTAELQDTKLFISSFNGDYIGYITPDRYYETSAKEELRVLNWVGPDKGDYFIELSKKLIEKSY